MKTEELKMEETAPVIDTSKMSAARRSALELTESAREAAGADGSFCGGLFLGRFNLAMLHPYPKQSATDRMQGDAFPPAGKIPV